MDGGLVRGGGDLRRELGDFGFEFFTHAADGQEEVTGRSLFRSCAWDVSRGERRDWGEGSALARGFEIGGATGVLWGICGGSEEDAGLCCGDDGTGLLGEVVPAVEADKNVSALRRIQDAQLPFIRR
jgi:hypothetical protein